MRRGAVTVVIPSRDRFDVLSRTLATVLGQHDVDLQVVVVEDAGSDGTAERLQGVDPRVSAVRHEVNRGVSQARNTGLERVQTPWVAFVDDDDLWAPGKLARQLDALEAAPECRWACSTAVSFYPDGRIPDIKLPPADPDVSVALLRGNKVPGGGSGVLAATDLVREAGGFDPALSSLADWDCWIRLAQRSPLAGVPAPDVGYRIHGTSMAHSVDRNERELVQLTAKHADLYRAAGAEVDLLPWLWYLHRLTYGGGRWRAGVRRSWSLFREHDRPRALSAPLKYAHPAVVHAWEDRRVRRLHPERYVEARAWLADATPELRPRT